MRVNTPALPVAITDFAASGQRKNREGVAEMSPFMG
jgi:hypothetical protein